MHAICKWFILDVVAMIIKSDPVSEKKPEQSERGAEIWILNMQRSSFISLDGSCRRRDSWDEAVPRAEAK